MPRTTSLLIIAVLVLLEHVAALGPVLPDLATAGDFVILATAGITNAGITDVEQSYIYGNIGVYTGTAASLIGFSLEIETSPPNAGQFAASRQLVGGKVYAADYPDPADYEVPPTSSKLERASGDMDDAYAAASSADCAADCDTYTDISLTGSLGPGLYTWGTSVTTSTNLNIDGTANDTWIFHSAGAVTIAANTQVILNGEAKAENIVWVVAGAMTVGENAHLKGIVMVTGAATFNTGASLDGRLLAETVTLQANTFNKPLSE
jgi:hypothetical protein